MEKNILQNYEAFPLQDWLEQYMEQVKAVFGERIVCIGLQGSYGRGEATPQSDIDVVVILDSLSFEDLKAYEAALEKLPHREMVCGFLSGMQEISNWEKADLFQFYHDTTPLYRDLEFLKDLIRLRDVKRAVLTGSCNLYHTAVHNALHEKSPGILKSMMKSACFILQAKYYCETGRYVRRRHDLAAVLTGTDAEILALCLNGLQAPPQPDRPADGDPARGKPVRPADGEPAEGDAKSDTPQASQGCADAPGIESVSELLMGWASGLICTYGN